MSIVLEVQNLTKRYGDLVAVNGVSFSVNRQEIFGILGPNGAGKTSTLEMIETLRPIDSGTVILDGLDVTKHPQKVKRIIGVQLQSSSFFDKLSLTELLLLFGEMYSRQVDPLAGCRKKHLDDFPSDGLITAGGTDAARLIHSKWKTECGIFCHNLYLLLSA